MPPEVFLDTAYAIALAATSDQLHTQAAALAEKLEGEKIHLITTQAVLLEIGNALAKRRYGPRPSSCCPPWRRIPRWK